MTSNKPATPSAKDELLQLLELLRVEGGQPNKASADHDRIFVEKVEAEAVASLTARLAKGVSWAFGLGDELDSNQARWVVLQLADHLGVKLKLPPQNKPNNRLAEQLAQAEVLLVTLWEALNELRLCEVQRAPAARFGAARAKADMLLADTAAASERWLAEPDATVIETGRERLRPTLDAAYQSAAARADAAEGVVAALREASIPANGQSLWSHSIHCASEIKWKAACDCGLGERRATFRTLLADTAAASGQYAEKLRAEGRPSAEQITEVLRGHVLTLNAVGVVCGDDYPGCGLAALWSGGPGGPGRHHSTQFKGFESPYCDGEMHGSHWGWIPETLAEHLARAFRLALAPSSKPKELIR